jgi:hypothetical protein
LLLAVSAQPKNPTAIFETPRRNWMGWKKQVLIGNVKSALEQFEAARTDYLERARIAAKTGRPNIVARAYVTPGMDSLRAILPSARRVNANLFQTDLCRSPGYMDVNSTITLKDKSHPCAPDTGLLTRLPDGQANRQAIHAGMRGN